MRHILVILLLSLSAAGCIREENVSPLMIAAKDGDLQAIRSLADGGAEINDISEYGWTALMFASWQGHDQIVTELLKRGADPNIKSGHVPSGFSTVSGHPPSNALAESISNGHIDIAYILMENGASIDPLCTAMAGKSGDIELLAYINNNGADFNRYSGNQFYPSALCSSIKSKKIDAVRWLCENGAQINIVLNHSSPLKFAVRSNRPEIVAFLLENGANPNLYTGDPDYHHNSPLGDAAMSHMSSTADSKKALDIVQLLLDHGADTSRRDSNGKTILEQKLIQQENARKYEEKNVSEDTDPRIKERFRVSKHHENEIIKMLKTYRE